MSNCNCDFLGRFGCAECSPTRQYAHNPDHDSIVLKFNQLERALDELRDNIPVDVKWRAESIRALIRLLRGQVLK